MKMKTITRFLAMLSIVCYSSEVRAAELSVSEELITNSDSLKLSMHLENDLWISGIQFSLDLPRGGFEVIAIEPDYQLAGLSIHWETRMERPASW